ncbi:related to Asp-tRNAAsn/Glu-tRNAGln amidotransferase A subunit and related amidases [Phialocephala subalpina]|uniref:Related to Asp-tRNAAsn/Glu-tRNAGln amidotransferase A subunit and related amidases n=1 Tax=Phialocephala subalpina TaxID=576137 RepID=A0A1L7XAV1_9HELO|nr:related to Asp-tRNAAsn/Glu-tRNAGln amidotransferase A subunit and related amidases [Phialocephala subalpina]
MASIQKPLPEAGNGFSIVEASISDLREALDQGWITSVELVARYLHRIAAYDRRGKLNSIPLLNLSVFEDATASDHRRANGLPIRSLEGIPFTVKDSYKVKGMTVASGSPAFQNLVANEDAFTVQKLRDAGAVLIGKTNMPPMAAGGMQRGFYGRAESPYNREYLTAAFASGSSNGSATSTAASFAAFGMAEETVSSGRSPASNNGLVAYTPSRGLISIRGNWPLYPTCDVVVPHTRTVRDLLHLLDVIVVTDECTTGDFWRDQPFIKLPRPSDVDVRPSSFEFLGKTKSLQGKRIGVPKIYIGQSEALNNPIVTRQSILDLWFQAKRNLELAGATVIETDFPLMEEFDTVSAIPPATSSKIGKDADVTVKPSDGITDEWNLIERRELVAYAWDDFLRQNGDPACRSLPSVDPSQIFPRPPGSLPDQYTRLGAPIPYSTLVSLVSSDRGSINSLPGMEAALNALENRRKSFESWLQAEKLDGIVFPANADVGRADADVNEESADAAWKNGALYSNGNRVLRHLGIPTVTVPMGIMADTRMPVGLTFAGKGYDDAKLLKFAFAYEERSGNRKSPGGTPELESDFIRSKVGAMRAGASPPGVTIEIQKRDDEDGHYVVRLCGTFEAADGLESLIVTVDGKPIVVSIKGDAEWATESELKLDSTPAKAEIDKTLVVVLALGKNGRSSAKLLLLD